jgi:hypothetical protein
LLTFGFLKAKQHDIMGKKSDGNRSSFRNVAFLEFVIPDEQSVRFEVYTAVTMKNGVFCDVTSCGSCKNHRYGGS